MGAPEEPSHPENSDINFANPKQRLSNENEEPISLEITNIHQIIELVDRIIDGIYQEVGAKLGISHEEVHQSQRCEDVSDLLRRVLNKKGIQAESISYSGWDLTMHQFVIIDNTYIVDPTWQQFLQKPNPSLPRVLIVSKDDLETKLNQFGLNDKIHYWLSPVSKLKSS